MKDLQQTISPKAALSVICYDACHLISGWLYDLRENGGYLRSSANDRLFASSAQVSLHILNERTGEAISVPARLGQAVRDDGAWVYPVRWPKYPELLEKLAA